MKGVERGDILRIVSAQKGRLRVATRSGDERTIQILERDFPEGSIESILPLLERITSKFPGIFGPDDTDFWLTLHENAPFSPEQAVVRLRSDGISSRVAGREAVLRVIKLSGKAPQDADKGLLQQLIDEASDIVREVYVETTEVRPRRPRRR